MIAVNKAYLLYQRMIHAEDERNGFELSVFNVYTKGEMSQKEVGKKFGLRQCQVSKIITKVNRSGL